MKYKTIAMSLLISVVSTASILAASDTISGFDVCDDPATTTSTLCTNTDTGGSLFGTSGILQNGLEIFVIVVGFASVATVIVGGFRYVLSAGDPQKTAAAKNTILYAIVGLVVALTAQGILTFVIKKV